MNISSLAPCLLAAAGLYWPTSFLLAADSPNAPNARMQITLEKQEATRSVVVSAEHVFAEGDLVRLHFKSNFNGYLFVIDQNTSGGFSLLFPNEAAGRENRLERGSDYVIPATKDGWFKVVGPAGFDVVYLLVSPTPLDSPSKYVPLPKEPDLPPVPDTLRPRCDDTFLKARGECIDPDAGVRAISPTDPVPGKLSEAAGPASRELVFIKKPDSTVVAANAVPAAPVIFQIRLAHK